MFKLAILMFSVSMFTVFILSGIPVTKTEQVYNCKSGDSFWNRKKYECSLKEWTRQQTTKEVK